MGGVPELRHDTQPCPKCGKVIPLGGGVWRGDAHLHWGCAYEAREVSEGDVRQPNGSYT